MFRKINNLFKWNVDSGTWIMAFGLWAAIGMTGTVRAQTDTLHSPLSTTRLDHYLKLAHPIGTVSLDFPGPDGGYTFVHLPTKEVTESGDTQVNPRTYLIDLNVSHEGLYIAPDTMVSFSDFTPFQFVLPNHRIIHAQLAPSHTHQDYLAIDSNFNGTIGWGLIKQFITVFDFKRNQLTFYPLYSSLIIADDDTNVIQLPIIDDAKITYCHCPVSTVWLDVDAPPLPEGHVNLAFQQPLSQIFLTGLDSNTLKIVERQHNADSIAGNKRAIGLSVAQFTVHDLGGHAINIADHGPHRVVTEPPPIYHDLTVPVMGALGTDVLRTFSGIIIDPSRNKLIFVK
ncbi:MAG TPA: hypothetical protein VFD13_04095 [Candidatus Kapabacteria bacterium]|nr:hypothetical protein [Candidatus Kapabacteria bacterium]